MYGYDIVKTLGEKNFSIDENTLPASSKKTKKRLFLAEVES